MAIIDVTYFINEINIPNTNQVAISSRLVGFINKYEPIFLQKALGYPLYDQFIAGYAAVPLEQKWKDLAEGAMFTYFGKQHKWGGLVDTIQKSSPIANYVYWYYMTDAHTYTSSVGEQKTKAENSTTGSPEFKMTHAWNEMFESVCTMLAFLEVNKDVYGNTQTMYEIQCKFGTTNIFGI